MKRPLLALTLLSAPLLANNCEDPTCPCSPKIKCTDCECYLPPSYDLQCDWGMIFQADFLYWYARETNLSYTMKVEQKNRGDAATTSLAYGVGDPLSLDTKWSPGFRVALGYNFDCSKWDTLVSWTWMYNSRRDTKKVPDNFFLGTDPFTPSIGEKILINQWISGDYADFVWDRVSTKWKFRYNNFDLELGYKQKLSPCFAIRPYAGLRGAFTKTTYRSESNRNTPLLTIPIYNLDNFKDRFSNRYWGVGLLVGLQPNFYLYETWLLFANISGSLIYGEYEAKKKERYSKQQFGIGQTVPTTLIALSSSGKSPFFMMQGIVDLGAGIRWEDSWCADRYRFSLDLGWEHHLWLDHNHRVKTVSNFTSTDSNEIERGYYSYDEATGNLQFGGFVLRLRFDF